MANKPPSSSSDAGSKLLAQVYQALGFLCLVECVMLILVSAHIGRFDFQAHTVAWWLRRPLAATALPLSLFAVVSGHWLRSRLRGSRHDVAWKRATRGLVLSYVALVPLVLTLYEWEQGVDRRPAMENLAGAHLLMLHQALTAFAGRHLSHTYPVRLDQLSVNTDPAHPDEKQVEGLGYFYGDVDVSLGYKYLYSPARSSAGGKVTAYTILARPQGLFWRGRVNFLLDENSVIHWTSENRPATARDPVWQEESAWAWSLDNYSVIPLDTRDDEILKKISIDYVQSASPGRAEIERVGVEYPLCGPDGKAVTAVLITDVALTQGAVSIPAGAYYLWIAKGTHDGWELVFSKNYNSSHWGLDCTQILGATGVVSVPMREGAIPNTQAQPTFKLAKEGDGIAVLLAVGDKSLSANFGLH